MQRLDRLRASPWVALLVLSLGLFMIVLDTTIVSIAVPSIIAGLDARLSDVLWVINAYVLAYAVLLITGGRLGDLIGQRRVFLVGLAIFTAASASCGVATDALWLIVSRLAQGIGAALLTPQTLAMLTSIFPRERRGTAFGIWGSVAGVAAITGPTLGGFLVTEASWRWIFFINVPVGLVAIAAAVLVLPDIRPHRVHRFDIGGTMLLTAGLIAIVFALIEGEHFGWGAIRGSITIPGIAATGAVLLAAFMLLERRQREPLLPPGLFRDPNFSLMNGVVLFMAFSMLGVFFILPIYLQSVLGLSAFAAGLTLAPISVVSAITAPFAGRVADRTGGHMLVAAGLLVYATAAAAIAFIARPDTPPASIAIVLAFGGFGLGSVLAPSTTIAMRDVELRSAGAASGVYNTMRQLGGLLGTAVVGAVLQHRLATLVHVRVASLARALPADERAAAFDWAASVATSGLGADNAAAATGSAAFSPIYGRAFVDAMRSALAVPIAVLCIAAAAVFVFARTRGER